MSEPFDRQLIQAIRAMFSLRLSICYLSAAVIGFVIVLVSPRDNMPIDDELLVDAITVREADLELGEIWQQRQLVHELRITNSGSTPIHIGEFRTSCSCTAVTPPQLTVPPKQDRVVSVTLNMMKLADRNNSDFMKSFTVDIRPVIERKGVYEKLIWRLRGRLVRHIVASANAMDYGIHSLLSQSKTAVTLQLRVHPSVRSCLASVSNSVFQAACESHSADPSVYSLAVTPVGKLPLGDCSCEIQVTPILHDGRRGPQYSIPVRGVIVQDVSPHPPQILIGDAAIGTGHEEDVVLTSRAGLPFRVLTLKTDKELAVTMHERDSDASTARLSVRTKVRERKGQQYAVRALIRDTANEEYWVFLPVIMLGNK